MSKHSFSQVTFKIKTALLFILIATSILFWVKSEYPNQQLLQHLGTLLVSLILIADLILDRLSLKAYIGVSLFILLHIIGARWIYSNVPYQSFFESIGIDIHELFNINSQRNHYDRLVHFSFGLLMVPFLFEIYRVRIENTIISLVFAWLTIQTFSMFYEVFEWILTVIIPGEGATEYNGQQGDVWDAQKDMALAMLGSTFTAIIYIYKERKK
jgi:putative membrane protein